MFCRDSEAVASSDASSGSLGDASSFGATLLGGSVSENRVVLSSVDQSSQMVGFREAGAKVMIVSH